MDRSAAPGEAWKISSPSFLLVALLAAFLLFLGVRGLLLPEAAAHGFGLPVEAGDLHWLRIKAARDLSLGLAIAALLALRRRAALAVLLVAGGVIPLLDCAVSLAHPSGQVAYALAVHGGAAAFTFGLAAALWRLPRSTMARRRQPATHRGTP